MKYVKISIDVTLMEDYEIDILTYNLSEKGCDSFETVQTECESKLEAYIDKTIFDAESLTDILEKYSYSIEDMPDKDWNEEWEKNSFTPIIVDDSCVICSPMHRDIPQMEYKIFIDPKMAFGTGYHQTTRCMISWILDESFEGKRVLDMGCGTAVLALLALKRGAASALGVDIDEWSVENAKYNAMLNDVTLDVMQGSASEVQNMSFDVIFANINLNILTSHMLIYSRILKSGGELYMSGYYVDDLPKLEACAMENGFILDGCKELEGWMSAKFIKK